MKIYMIKIKNKKPFFTAKIINKLKKTMARKDNDAILISIDSPGGESHRILNILEVKRKSSTERTDTI